jgi:hypothetical protein
MVPPPRIERIGIEVNGVIYTEEVTPPAEDISAWIAETHREVIAAMQTPPAVDLPSRTAREAARRREQEAELHRLRLSTFGGYGEHYCYCSPMRSQMLAAQRRAYDRPYSYTPLEPDWTGPLIMSASSDWDFPPAWLCWTVGLSVLAAVALLLAILL